MMLYGGFFFYSKDRLFGRISSFERYAVDLLENGAFQYFPLSFENNLRFSGKNR